MKPEPIIPHGCRPLGLARGYLISADGRVFNERTRREIKSFTISKARRLASADIAFDPNRLSRQPLGPVPPERLVTTDIVADVFIRPDGTTIQRTREIEVTQWVRLPSKRELEPLARGETVTAFTNGPVPARGDTSQHWYYLATDATDPDCTASLLMHGPSVAHKLFTGA